MLGKVIYTPVKSEIPSHLLITVSPSRLLMAMKSAVKERDASDVGHDATLATGKTCDIRRIADLS